MAGATVSLDFERRRNIYLLCKEAINNAVKYGEGDLLILSFEHQADRLTNMRKRAEEIGARLIIQSDEKEGTTISVECPMT